MTTKTEQQNEMLERFHEQGLILLKEKPKRLELQW
jgi:hypothetical protein